MRKDAEENRRRLIAVARAALQKHGGNVSLDAIAAQAGVGRSTLFRNFADRMELIAAVQRFELDAIAAEERRTRADPGAVFTLMRMVARITVLYRAMSLTLLQSEQGAAAFVRNAHECAGIFQDAVARAKAAGLLRPDLTPEAVVMASGMAASVNGFALGLSQDAAIQDGLDLLMRGMAGPRAAASAPGGHPSPGEPPDGQTTRRRAYGGLATSSGT